jgi:hypothetical protein
MTTTEANTPCSPWLRITHLDAFVDHAVPCVVVRLDGATSGELLLTAGDALDFAGRLLDAAMALRKRELEGRAP